MNTEITPAAGEFSAILSLCTLTKSERADPRVRAERAEALWRAGGFPERAVAYEFVSAYYDHADGKPMVPALRAWLDESTKMCEQFLAGAKRGREALAIERERQVLFDDVKRAESEIACEEQNVKQLQADMDAAHDQYMSSAGRRAGLPILRFAEYGLRVTQDETTINLIRERVLPVLAQRLVSAQRAYEDFELKHGAAATPPPLP